MISRSPRMLPTHSSTYGQEPLSTLTGPLTQLMDELALNAVLIATREGLLMARPEQLDRDDADMLAALAPMLHDAQVPQWTRNQLRTILPAWSGQALATHQFRLYNQPLLVLTAASDDHAAEQGVRDALSKLRDVLIQEQTAQVSA